METALDDPSTTRESTQSPSEEEAKVPRTPDKKSERLTEEATETDSNSELFSFFWHYFPLGLSICVAPVPDDGEEEEQSSGSGE